MSPKMANMTPKTTQDRVQVGTKIEKNGFQEGLKKRQKNGTKKHPRDGGQKLQDGGVPLNN